MYTSKHAFVVNGTVPIYLFVFVLLPCVLWRPTLL